MTDLEILFFMRGATIPEEAVDAMLARLTARVMSSGDSYQLYVETGQGYTLFFVNAAHHRRHSSI